MTDAITDKTMVLITKLGDFWITKSQAENIMALTAKDTNGHVIVDENMISLSRIDGVLSANAYNELNYRRRGAWQCRYRYWHERHQQCAHQKYNVNV